MKRTAMLLALCVAFPLIACGQQEAQQTFTQDITPAPLQLLTTTVPGGQMSVPFPPFTFVAQGGLLPYLWDVPPAPLGAGPLPPGLTLDTNTGVLSGTPTATGSFSYSIRVTDNGGNAVIRDFRAGAGAGKERPTG